MFSRQNNVDLHAHSAREFVRVRIEKRHIRPAPSASSPAVSIPKSHAETIASGCRSDRTAAVRLPAAAEGELLAIQFVVVEGTLFCWCSEVHLIQETVL